MSLCPVNKTTTLFYPTTFNQKIVNTHVSELNGFCSLNEKSFTSPHLGGPPRIIQQEETPSRLSMLMQASAKPALSCLGSLIIGASASVITQNSLPLVLLAATCIDTVNAETPSEKLAKMAHQAEEKAQQEEALEIGRTLLERSADLAGKAWKYVCIPLQSLDIIQTQRNCIAEGHNQFACFIGTATNVWADEVIEILFIAEIIESFEAGTSVASVIAGVTPTSPLILVGAAGLMVVGPEIAKHIGKIVARIAENTPEKILDAAMKYSKIVTNPSIKLAKMAAKAQELSIKKSQTDEKAKKEAEAKKIKEKKEAEVKKLKIKKEAEAKKLKQEKEAAEANERERIQNRNIQINNAAQRKDEAINAYNAAVRAFTPSVKECLWNFEQPPGNPLQQPFQNTMRQWVELNGCFVDGVHMSLNQARQIRNAVNTALANMNQAIQHWQSLMAN